MNDFNEIYAFDQTFSLNERMLRKMEQSDQEKLSSRHSLFENQQQTRYVYPLFLSNDSPNGDETIQATMRKRKFKHVNNISKNKKYIRLPKVLSTDIRKKYPFMILNIMNGCNYHNISDFTHQFIDRDCQLTWSLTKCPNRRVKSFDEAKEHTTMNSKFCVQLDSLSNIIDYLFFLGLILPDRVFQMIHSNVITRSDSLETRIEIYYRMDGTKLYLCTPIQAGAMVKSLPMSSMDDSIDSQSDSSSGGEELEQISKEGRIEQCDMNHEFSLYKIFYQNIKSLPVKESVYSFGRVTLLIENHHESNKIKDFILESFLYNE